MCHSTNYTLIESEVSEEVSNEYTEPSRNIFVNISNAEINEFRTKAETKNTKDNIKWATQAFERKMEKFHKFKYRVLKDKANAH